LVPDASPERKRALLEAADQNLHTHMSWVQQRVPGMHLVVDDQLMLADSGLPSDTFNFISRTRLEKSRPRDRVDAALKYVRTTGRPFSWWVCPTDLPPELGEMLLDAGFRETESEVGMAVDLNTLLLAGGEPPGLRIERVLTPATLEVYATLLANLGDPPDTAVSEFYRRGAPVLLAGDSPFRLYIGYLAEEPVATSETAASGSTVGLYNISTAKPHRGKGIGHAMTRRLLMDAMISGFRLAVLQAAAAGVNLYRRLGFTPICTYREYKA
jgi:ribosomal protein S18 acetylase RimI-like enzyme